MYILMTVSVPVRIACKTYTDFVHPHTDSTLMPGNANVQQALQPIDPPEMEGMSQDDNHLMSSQIQDIGIVDRRVVFGELLSTGSAH